MALLYYTRCPIGYSYNIGHLVYYTLKMTCHYTKWFIVYEVVYSIPVDWCHFV